LVGLNLGSAFFGASTGASAGLTLAQLLPPHRQPAASAAAQQPAWPPQISVRAS